jgi:DNA-binding NarL/FixJ family response regulator
MGPRVSVPFDNLVVRTPPDPEARPCPGNEPPRREELRALALEADERAAASVNLSSTWTALAGGEMRAVDVFCSTDRCLMILVRSPLDAGRRELLDGRTLELLILALQGHAQKFIAIECQRSASSVSTALKRALESMGVPRTGSKIPTILVSLARARQGASVTHGRQSSFSVESGSFQVVSIRRPETVLARILSGGEYAVVLRYLDGLSYTEIARERGASRRTVANQLSSVFRRLRVSGRQALLARIVEDASVS